MNTERKDDEVVIRPYFRLAFIIVCLILLSFVAFKEGFSLWLLSTLRLNKEYMTPGPPGQSPNVLGMCR